MERIRQFAALTAAALAAVLVLAACGSGNGEGGGGTSSEGEVDPDGVLRMGASLVGAGEAQLDPAASRINTDEPWLSMIYGSLARPTAENTYEPWLAESIEVTDPSTLTVTLREGITFTDGAAYDAEAVRTGILRNLREPESPAVTAGQHSLFRDLTDIVVVSPTELTFTLDQPVAGEFVAVLAGRESAVPSPQALAEGVDLGTTPVGAGPYVLEAYQPGQIISLRKNPDFVDADDWQLGGFDFVHTPDGPSAVTALRSGTIDIVTTLTPADAGALAGTGGVEVLRHFTDFSYWTINFCSTKPPFDDAAVRQAFQRAIDREELNQLFLSGEGEPAHGFWRDESENFDPDLPEALEYDPELAEQLLAEAGATGIEVDLWFSTGVSSRLMEIVQGQLSEVGVRVNLRPTQDIISEFIGPQAPGMTVNPGSRPGVDKINRLFQPGTVQNLCGAERTEIVELTAQIAELPPGDPARVDLWQQIDQINTEGAFVVPLVWGPALVGVDRDRVGGELEFTESRNPGSWMSFQSLFIKA